MSSHSGIGKPGRPGSDSGGAGHDVPTADGRPDAMMATVSYLGGQVGVGVAQVGEVPDVDGAVRAARGQQVGAVERVELQATHLQAVSCTSAPTSASLHACIAFRLNSCFVVDSGDWNRLAVSL